ncbi:acyl-CoA thioesterase [Streptomyces sp. NPDC052727]|uniref:acyl-CoA thioesterase n=1 Tax=unclassified Streptomyces TaxID=2593676 RepID=UPI00343F86F6
MMSTAATSASLSTAAVGVLVPAEVHFDELDAMGLLHNSRYQVLVERAWTAFWYAQGFGGSNGLENDAFNVVKAFTITYEAPVSAPGTYAVNLWIDRLGTTSATAGYRVCSSDGGTTYAHGTRTAIRLDPATFLPTPWSDRARDVARTIMAPQKD